MKIRRSNDKRLASNNFRKYRLCKCGKKIPYHYIRCVDCNNVIQKAKRGEGKWDSLIYLRRNGL